MDQPGQSGSMGDGSGWGAMGGNPGDGIAGNNMGGATPVQPPYATTPNYGSPQRGPPPQQQPYYSPPSSGSVTRFATPEANQQQSQQAYYSGGASVTSQDASYAARSQQQQQQGGYQQQQLGGYQQQPAPKGPPSVASGAGSYAAQPVSPYQMTPAPQAHQQSTYYAARSAQPYATQPPANQPPATTGSYASRSVQAYNGGASQAPPAGGYAARSAQAYGAPATATGSFAARSAQAYGAPSQQQPPPQQHQQPNMSATPPMSGSYAARSVQAYSSPQSQQVQQQQQPIGGSGGGGSYANRSSQAYGAPPQQQQPPPQQPPPQQPPPQQPPQSGAPVPGYPSQGPPAQPVPQQQPQQAGGMAGTPQAQQQQQRLLTDATRKVQEHAHYMRQAMEQKSMPVVLDRAAHMVGELGGPPHGQHNSSTLSNTGGSAKLTPKNYYELYMRALEEMPNFEDYLLNLVEHPNGMVPAGMIQIVDSSAPKVNRAPFTMHELYDCVQYCPRVVSRLYLQISAGSALIRSGEAGAKWVLHDLGESVRCEQNPIRGLFLRHFLLTALRDKLPDTPPAPETSTDDDDESKMTAPIDLKDPGTVKDSYEFVLTNFMEMNKLWVRIQHLPGEGNNKDVKKRRERERNDLRILVGTNLVRLSQLECITSQIYGEIILPQILDHIVTCGDPLSQAYLMDCLVQVFPDEYHIETLQVLLGVCPRLRDKVNIRTILQGLMDRLANYLAEEELLDEHDSNEVKKALARDSFGLFEVAVQKVYNARGPKLTSREVIRLQTALAQFSVKCYPGNMEQLSQCLGVCVSALRQANASYDVADGTMAAVPPPSLDDVSVVELEKLLSIPLDSLALKVLELDHYGDLIGFLPWASRASVARTLLEAVYSSASTPRSVKEIEELFQVIGPLMRDEFSAAPNAGANSTMQATNLMAGMGVNPSTPQAVAPAYYNPEQLRALQKENALVSKLVHLLDHDDTDLVYEMLVIARTHIQKGGPQRTKQTLISVVFAGLRLARRVFENEQGIVPAPEPVKVEEDGTEAVESKSADGTGEEVSKAESKEEDKETGDATPGEGASDEVEESVEAAIATDTTEGETKISSDAEPGAEHGPEPTEAPPKAISCRKIFIFIQETISTLAYHNPEIGIKLYLDVAMAADNFSDMVTKETSEFGAISYELLSQAYSKYEEGIADSRAQQRCIETMVGTLLALRTLSNDDYEGLTTKTAQFAAKVLKKPVQCHLVSLCAHLFYPTGSGSNTEYSNPQRALECLQRSLKLADACTSASPGNVKLFVDLLEHYLLFFEKKNPHVTHTYISGLIALIREHITNKDGMGGDGAVAEAKAQFLEVIVYIKEKKGEESSAAMFGPIQVEIIAA